MEYYELYYPSTPPSFSKQQYYCNAVCRNLGPEILGPNTTLKSCSTKLKCKYNPCLLLESQIPVNLEGFGPEMKLKNQMVKRNFAQALELIRGIFQLSAPLFFETMESVYDTSRVCMFLFFVLFLLANIDKKLHIHSHNYLQT